MPTKRTVINRQRTPPIDAETVKLFAELEAVPPRRRKSDEFKARDRELHRRLGLGGEWLCAVVSVLDRGPHYYLPESPHHEGAERVRAMRERLLAMAGMSEPQPEKAKPARKRTREPA
jgi:hypothetical protein